jgi:hypothetical protein
MRRLLFYVVPVSLFVAACSSPAPAAVPAPSPVTSTLQVVIFSGPFATLIDAGATAQIVAIGTFTNGITQDVTATCGNWQSDNTGVLTVNSGGLLTAQSGSGSAMITTTCQGILARDKVTIGGGPTLTLTGTLTDGTSHGILPDITIQIVSGANAGRSTITDGGGNYAMSGLSAGTFTLSVFAVSYLTTTQSVALSGNTRVDLILQRAPAPTLAESIPNHRRHLSVTAYSRP